MARKVEFKKFLIIECTVREMYVACGSPGICDFCGDSSSEGYYIAVLNHWYCPECFEEWKQRARYYPQDAVVERRNYAYYASRLGLKSQ